MVCTMNSQSKPRRTACKSNFGSKQRACLARRKFAEERYKLALKGKYASLKGERNFVAEKQGIEPLLQENGTLPFYHVSTGKNLLHGLFHRSVFASSCRLRHLIKRLLKIIYFLPRPPHSEFFLPRFKLASDFFRVYYAACLNNFNFNALYLFVNCQNKI